MTDLSIKNSYDYKRTPKNMAQSLGKLSKLFNIRISPYPYLETIIIEFRWVVEDWDLSV